MNQKWVKNVYCEQPYSHLNSEVHFWKMRLKMKSKMSRKWSENGYCEQPYSVIFVPNGLMFNI